MTIGTYEQHCNDYAVHGNPERDHYDYEEAARYDRYDGWGDPDPCLEDLCYACFEEDAECAGCRLCREWAEKWDCIVREDQVRLNRLADDPNSPHYIPF